MKRIFLSLILIMTITSLNIYTFAAPITPPNQLIQQQGQLPNDEPVEESINDGVEEVDSTPIGGVETTVEKVEVIEEKLGGIAGESKEAQDLADRLNVPKLQDKDMPKIEDPDKAASPNINVANGLPPNGIQSADGTNANNAGTKSSSVSTSSLIGIAIGGILVALLLYFGFKYRSYIRYGIKNLGNKIVEFKRSVFSFLLIFLITASLFQIPGFAETSISGVKQFGYDDNRRRTAYDNSIFLGYRERVTLKDFDAKSISQPIVIYPDAAKPNDFYLFHFSGAYLYKIKFENFVKKSASKVRVSSSGVSSSHPTYFNGHIYLGTREGKFMKIRTSDMKVMFSKDLGMKIVAAPYVMNSNYVVTGYCTTNAGGIAVYDIKANKIKMLPGASGWVSSSGVAAGNTFYFLSDDARTEGYLYRWVLNSSKFYKIKIDSRKLSDDDELNAGGAASLTKFGDYIIFVDKDGFFYSYHTPTKRLIVKAFTANKSGIKITYNSPGATSINKVPVAVFPISYRNNAWTKSGAGKVVFTRIDSSADSALWTSDSNGGTAIGGGLEMAPIFVRDATKNKFYVAYGDRAGEVVVGDIGGPSSVGKAAGFMNITKPLAGISSEFTFTGNKLIFSTVDGKLHIFSPNGPAVAMEDKIELVLNTYLGDQSSNNDKIKVKSGYGFGLWGEISYRVNEASLGERDEIHNVKVEVVGTPKIVIPQMKFAYATGVKDTNPKNSLWSNPNDPFEQIKGEWEGRQYLINQIGKLPINEATPPQYSDFFTKFFLTGNNYGRYTKIYSAPQTDDGSYEIIPELQGLVRLTYEYHNYEPDLDEFGNPTGSWSIVSSTNEKREYGSLGERPLISENTPVVTIEGSMYDDDQQTIRR